jgi:ATP-dependent DNA helicase RecQ
MIIDCLVSLPRPVGRSGLARILTGSLRAPVTPDQARHHGRLKALGESTILSYVDELLETHSLRQYERQGYPVLAPTIRGRSDAEAWLAAHPELADYSDIPVTEEQTDDEAEPAAAKYTSLQRAIWSWRRRRAEEQGQPPYMIMSNELMLQIAETRPQSMDELAVLPGIGRQRLEYYGPSLLDLVQLNPVEEGDSELLATQRANQPSRAAHSPGADHAEQSTVKEVSPQLERRIFLKLQEYRQKTAVREGTKPYLIASNNLLKAIAKASPISSAELDRLAGFRKSGLHAHEEQIVDIIIQIRKQLAEPAD